MPLAVLGVLPLLWNMVKSFLIYYRLKKSIAGLEIRREFSIVMDPAAGTVAVSHPRFEMLLSDVLTLRPWECEMLLRPHDWLLCKSWMCFATIGQPVHTTMRRNDIQRFQVSSDMNIGPVRVQIRWNTFVIIALALGTDPYTTDFRNLKEQLSTPFRDMSQSIDSGHVVITVLKRDDVVTARISPISSLRQSVFDSRTALAWASVMVVHHGDRVNLIPSKRNAAADELLSCIPDEHKRHRTLDERFASYSHADLGIALVWAFYSDAMHRNIPFTYSSLFLHREDSARNPLVGPQYLLKTRIKVLGQLRQIESLEMTLRSILATDEEDLVVDKILPLLNKEVKSLNFGFESCGPHSKPQRLVLATDLARECDELTKRYQMMENNDSFRTLREHFDPTLNALEDANLDLLEATSEMGILARVMVAISSMRFWPVHGEVVLDENGYATDLMTVPDPMEGLLNQEGNLVSHNFLDKNIYLE